MARGSDSGLLQRPIQKVGRPVLAIAGIVSVVFAFAGGTLAIGTPIGDLIRRIIGFTKGWAPLVVIVLLILAVILSLIDVAADGVPNQYVVGSAALVPSISSAFPTGFGNWIVDRGRELAGVLNDWLFAMAGNQSTFALAAACLVTAGVIAMAVLSKAGTGSRVVMRG